MEVKYPRVSALFDATIDELARSSVTPVPREAVWLHALCEDVVAPDNGEVSAWLSPVITIGRVELFPVTVQARLWIDAYASKWWADDYLMDVLSTAWAMAHGTIPGVFQRMTGRIGARLKITAWAVAMPVTFEQLRDALRRYFGKDETVSLDSPIEPKAVQVSDWGEILARACHAAKASPADVLLWNEAQLLNVLSAASGPKGDIPPEKIKALEALRLAKAEIIKRHTVTA